MSNSTLQKAIIKFNFGQRKITFEVVSNLESMNLSITAAFENWSARLSNAKDCTEENFCEYVRSKDEVNIICIPFSTFEKLNKKQVKYA